MRVIRKTRIYAKMHSYERDAIMQVVTASEVKNQLGDLFDAVERDDAASVLIERNRRPVAMLLNARIAEKVILGAYAQGVLPRSIAMRQLGLDWYGDLLQRMNAHGISRPAASADDAAKMMKSLDQVFSSLSRSQRSPTRKKALGV